MHGNCYRVTKRLLEPLASVLRCCWGINGIHNLLTEKRADVGLQCRVAAGPSQSGGPRKRAGIKLGEGFGEVIERAA